MQQQLRLPIETLRIRNALFFTCLCLVLVSCTTPILPKESKIYLENELSPHVGNSIHGVIDDFGYPTKSETVADTKIYVWEFSTETSSYSQSAPSSSGFSFGLGFTTTIECFVRVKVDEQEIVTEFSVDQSWNGCAHMIRDIDERKKNEEE